MSASEDLCAVCNGAKSSRKDQIIYCDGQDCDIPVHQCCYGVKVIPEGDWFCQRCEDSVSVNDTNIICCLSGGGATKRTIVQGGYMHVICALWCKSVFHEIEPYAFDKNIIGTRVCYLCNEVKGICEECEDESCKNFFHITCAVKANIIDPINSKKTYYSTYCQLHQPGKPPLDKNKIESAKETTGKSLIATPVQVLESTIKNIPMKRVPTPIHDETPHKKKNNTPENEICLSERPKMYVSLPFSKQSTVNTLDAPHTVPLLEAQLDESKSENEINGTTIKPSSKGKKVKKSSQMEETQAPMDVESNEVKAFEGVFNPGLPTSEPFVLECLTPCSSTTEASETKPLYKAATAPRIAISPLPAHSDANQHPSFEEYKKIETQLKSAVNEIRRLRNFRKTISHIFKKLNSPLLGGNSPDEETIEHYVKDLYSMLERTTPVTNSDRSKIQQYVEHMINKSSRT
ncbi:hypothetical protein BDF14DRAFT_1754089 [Spinellus fusiger]|nr:hypothetical protein BDF14DRAFT_1754089 [Spinellus fusiger]